MMVPRTWRQLDGEKSEDVVQEWLFLKTGALVADWKLLHVLVCTLADVLGYRVLWPRVGHS